MKIPGFDSQRPSESSLRDIVNASDARLGTHSTVDFRPEEPCAVNVNDLARAHEPDHAVPDDGFVPPPASGGVKGGW